MHVQRHNKLTACILANKNSNIRDVIPRSELDLSPRLLMSPSIVYVFPLPVYIFNDSISHTKIRRALNVLNHI